jgi:cysteinyl-tRNA synthetase
VGGRTTRAADAAPNAATEQAAKKISKSTGASPFSELIDRHSPETIRFFLLSTHYRSPIQYSEELLEETATSLEAFYRFFKRYERITGQSFYKMGQPAARTGGEFDPGSDPMRKQIVDIRDRFLEAMDDDFNTGSAIGKLFDLVRLLNKFADAEKLEGTSEPSADALATLTQGTKTLREMAVTLGLFRKPVEMKSSGDDSLVAQLMELLIELRALSRKNKDFATADRIRKRLAEIGVMLEDRPGGTEWTRG